MFFINNKTPYVAEAMVMEDQNGVKAVVTIVKATFSFTPDGRVKRSEEQVPLRYGDEYWGEPGKTSLKYTSDLVLEKKGTDIALVGHAYALGHMRAKTVDAALRVGPLLKRVRVFGDRLWRYRAGRVTPSSPVPFAKMPLVYERAFGGEDRTHKKEQKHGYCEENPVGTGFRLIKSRKTLEGHPLPNLEAHENTIRSWTDKPEPAGFGFIAPSWVPRSTYGGTFDEKWKRTRRPFLPDDFDARFNNAATPDLIMEGFLKGTEPVVLMNLHPAREKIAFNLPSIHLRTACLFEEETFEPETVLDTLTIEPDENRFTLVWRSRFSKYQSLSRLKQINVAYEENN